MFVGEMIPESFIHELLQRVDLVQLIDGYVPLKRHGADFAACCPFHNEKSPSFTVSPSKQFYHCFGCGAHGTAIGFMMAYAGVGFQDAVKDLAARVGLSLPEQHGVAPAPAAPTQGLAELMARAARFYREQLKSSDKAIAYLKARGVSGEVARRFGLGYSPDAGQALAGAFAEYASPQLQALGLVTRNEQGRLYDRFRDRVMFPIINLRGEVIAFGGRVVGQGEPKYLNSPETPLFHKGNELYGLPQARLAIRARNQVIVVEGYMDVVALAQHGIDNVAAALGTATTVAHVQKLLRQADKIIFCFDGDAAGRKAAWRALENSLEVLPEQKEIGFVFLPEGDDPDSFVRRNGTTALGQMVERATPLSEYMLRELAGRCDLASAEGSARLLAEARPMLARLSSPLLRLQLVKRLAKLSGLAQSEVESLYGLPAVTRQLPPAYPSRRPPSLPRKLLRILLQRPQLIHRVPLDLLPEASAEARVVRLLGQLAGAGKTPADAGYASLLECLRGKDDESVLQEAAAELMQQQLAEDEVEAEFEGALARLREHAGRRAFSLLQAKIQKLGLAGLSSEEKQQYLTAIGLGSGSGGGWHSAL